MNNIIGSLGGALLLSGAMFGQTLAMGTAPPEVQEVRVAPLYSGTQCSADTPFPRVQWLSTLQDYQAFLRRLQGGTLGMPPVSVGDIDFFREAVLLIDMGRQPTSGFGLTLGMHEARVEGSTLVVTVNRIEPGPGSVTAQVITHPCLVLRVTRDGYYTVRVVDQNGFLLGLIGID